MEAKVESGEELTKRERTSLKQVTREMPTPEKFSYGAADVKKYYSKFDAAVTADIG